MIIMYRVPQRGATLLDAVVGVSLMLIVFVGIAGVFKISIDVVLNNKARTGALALAQEQIEKVRALEYFSVGTQGGIPSGALTQIETVTLNGITYTRRTLIRYYDDPLDGTGASDTNHITADSKEVKVEVSWSMRGVLHTESLVTRVSPPGVEQTVPGGTLQLRVVDSEAAPVSGALVSVVNQSTSINTQAYSDADGYVPFIGTPAGTGYHITVTKSGYNSAGTYTASSTNPTPTPGDLTVSLNQTTAATFAIAPVANYTIRSFEAIQEKTWSDPFDTSAGLFATASTTVSDGELILSGGAGSYESEGSARSVSVAPSYLVNWKSFSATDTQPEDTSITYRIYSGETLVPDTALPGNAVGFTGTPIDVSSVSTTTYPSLRIDAVLTSSDPSETPSVTSWVMSYDAGPTPLPHLAFSLRGTKTIGSNAGNPVYLYQSNLTTDAGSTATISGLTWDTYVMSVSGSTGYDVALSCTPQPRALAPGESATTDVWVLPHTTHTLLVDVRDASGNLINGASVRVYRTGVNVTQETAWCGQTFFTNMAEGSTAGGNAYSVQVSKSGYTTQTISNVDISGQSVLGVTFP